MALFLSGKELNIIDQQKIHARHVLFEGFDIAVLNGFHDPFHELQGLDVVNLFVRIVLFDVVADRHQKMGFAQSGVAVDKERIEISARIIGTGKCRSLRLAVAVADDKVIERTVCLNRHRGKFGVIHFCNGCILHGIMENKFTLLQYFELNGLFQI